jgi:hypothetical protein
MYLRYCIVAFKEGHAAKLKKEDTVTTSCARIWGKYVHITTATIKAAVSPITTKTYHMMMAILAETCSAFNFNF